MGSAGSTILDREIDMLILTRRSGESIKIGDGIDITILACKGSQVRVGIKAPTSISVHRKEVYERIQSDKIRSRSKEKTKDCS